MILLLVTLFTLSTNGFGQTTPTSAGTVITNGISLAMGNTNKMLDFLMKNGNVLRTSFNQDNQAKAAWATFATAGSIDGWTKIARTNFETLVQSNLKFPGWLDPTKEFSALAAIAISWDKNEPEIMSFGISYHFFLVKDEFDTYHVPVNIVSYRMGFFQNVPVAYVPHASWARVEVFDRNGNWVSEGDNFINPIDENGLVTFIGPYLLILSEYACSGDTGPYIVKVILVSDGQYMVFDGMGQQITETPIVIAARGIADNLRLTVSGGNTYRPFAVQESTNLRDWTTIRQGRIPAGGDGWEMDVPRAATGNAFYRVAGIPDPGRIVLPPGN